MNLLPPNKSGMLLYYADQALHNLCVAHLSVQTIKQGGAFWTS